MTRSVLTGDRAVEYYLFISGNGGTDPESLLATCSSPDEETDLLEAIDDINYLFSLTAPLREAAATGDGGVELSRFEENDA